MPPKQQNEHNFQLVSPRNPCLYTVCTSLAVMKLWDFYEPFLSRVSGQLAVALTDGWDAKPSCQKGRITAKYHLKFGVRCLSLSCGKRCCPGKAWGGRGGRSAACPLRSCLLRHKKSHAGLKRSMTEEVPGPLLAALVAEDSVQRKQLLADAHASEGKAAIRARGDWRMSPKNTSCVLRRAKQTAPWQLGPERKELTQLH